MGELAFEYSRPATRVVFGAGRTKDLGLEVETLGAKRALVICGNTFAKSDYLSQIRGALGGKFAGIFSGVRPHSSVEIVTTGARLASNLEADVLVGIGGGSVLDTTKLIAILMAEGRDLEDWAIDFEPPDKYRRPELRQPKLPIIGIPTTYSASETNGGCCCRQVSTGRKLFFHDEGVVPRIAILDPELTATMPPELTGSSGMNMLGHCVEALYSRKRNPIVDAYALQAIRLIAQYLPGCVRNGNDLYARGQLQIAAYLSGLALSGAWVGLHHSLCHVLGARYDVPHGIANAIMLPHAMRYNLDATAERQAMVAETMGMDVTGVSSLEAGTAAIEAITELTRKIGLPQRLRDIGVPREGLLLLAEDAMYNWNLHTNPKPITDSQQVLAVFLSAW